MKYSSSRWGDPRLLSRLRTLLPEPVYLTFRRYSLFTSKLNVLESHLNVVMSNSNESTSLNTNLPPYAILMPGME